MNEQKCRGHMSAMHRDACPICNPNKTVPELNAAAGSLRPSNQQAKDTELQRVYGLVNHWYEETNRLRAQVTGAVKWLLSDDPCNRIHAKDILLAALGETESEFAEKWKDHIIQPSPSETFDEPPVMGAGGGRAPMPTVAEAIAAHVRQIQILSDAAGYDPAQWLNDETAQREPEETEAGPAPFCSKHPNTSFPDIGCPLCDEIARRALKASEPPLPAGWVEHSRHGDYVEGRRGHESAMFHLHMLHRPPTVHYCNWVGRNVACCACGNSTRLPENGKGDGK